MKHTLVFHLIGLSKKFQKVVGQNSRTSPLSYTQATTLLVIDSLPFANQSEIAKRLHLQPASVVPLIDELERLSLVKRNVLPKNRRTYQILLTENGKSELISIKKEAHLADKFIKKQLTSDEFRHLKTSIEKLTRSLETPMKIQSKNKKGGEKWITQH